MKHHLTAVRQPKIDNCIASELSNEKLGREQVQKARKKILKERKVNTRITERTKVSDFEVKVLTS